MDGDRFDELIRRVYTTRLNRLTALRRGGWGCGRSPHWSRARFQEN